MCWIDVPHLSALVGYHPAAWQQSAIYQHEARGADKAITDAIDTHVLGEQGKADGAPTHSGPLANGTLMVRTPDKAPETIEAQIRKTASELGLLRESG